MTGFPLQDKCIAKAEQIACPKFTLLACDDLALPLLRRWIKKAIAAGTPAEKITEAKALARRWAEWRKKHPELCKVPD